MAHSEILRYRKGRSRSGYSGNGRTYSWLDPVVTLGTHDDDRPRGWRYLPYDRREYLDLLVTA